MSNTILIKRSGTAAAIPGSGNLSLGELAINYTDGNLFYKDAGGTVKVIASNQTFTLSGNIAAGNISTGGLITATGNIIAGNVVTVGQVSATGNVTGNYFTGNGRFLTGIDTTLISNGTSNIRVYSNGNIAISSNGTSNIAVFTDTGGIVTGTWSVTGNTTTGNISTTGIANIGTLSVTGNSTLTGTVSITGNVSGGNISLSGNIATGGILTDGYYYANGSPVDFQQPAGSNTQIQFNNNNNFGATANLTFDSATDILSVGGQITSTGAGNASNGGGQLYLNGATNNRIDWNTNGTGAPAFTTRSDGTKLLLYPTLTGSLADYAIGIDSATMWSSIPEYSDSFKFKWYGATTEVANLSGTGVFSAAGNVTGANVLTGGLISATGNITGGNILTGGLISATGNITGGNVLFGSGTVSGTGNVTGGNILFGSGTVSGTGTVTTSGNITGGNVLFGSGVVSGTGNITGGNVLFGTGQVSGTGNITGGNVIFGSGTVSGTGNIDGGNLNVGIVSASGNLIAGNISTSGNITGANVIAVTAIDTGNVNYATSITIAPASGNINLSPASGNIVLSNSYINGVAYPAQDQDAASKIYVDNMVSTGLAYHPPVLAATITDLDTATGGTVSYSQPNGVGNGVGALLTTTGAFDLIDSSNVQTIGTRILVKNEANAVYNGVYTYANTTAIVRSTDADQYGPDSTEELSLNDYFFVQTGNINAGSAYVVSSPSGTITFGTSNITFAQFSSSQTYFANTAAGLVLIDQTFNAKIDNNTTAFDGGGNIVVKASANLTTPNIGSATGTSLSLSGNVVAGNLDAGSGVIVTTGNVTGGNILFGSGTVSGTGTVTTSGNITGGNVLFGSGIVSGTGNITGGNVNAGTGIITTSGNITGGNVLFGTGQVSGTGNITAGNIETAGVANVANLIVYTFANVTSSTAATDTTTGALRVAGGVGVVGNIYAGAMYVGTDSVLTINSTVDGGTY